MEIEDAAGAAEVQRRDSEWRGVKKEEHASRSADAKARLGITSDLGCHECRTWQSDWTGLIFLSPLYFFPQLFSSFYFLPLFHCLISILLFECACVLENTRA